jgi:biotin carboxylase
MNESNRLQVRAALREHGPKVVLKSEYSSSGLGLRVCEGAASLASGAAAER